MLVTDGLTTVTSENFSYCGYHSNCEQSPQMLRVGKDPLLLQQRSILVSSPSPHRTLLLRSEEQTLVYPVSLWASAISKHMDELSWNQHGFLLFFGVFAKMSPISFTWKWMNVRAWTHFKGSKVLVNRVETDVQRTQMKSQGSPSTVNRKQHCVINKQTYPTRRRMHSRTSRQCSKTSQP